MTGDETPKAAAVLKHPERSNSSAKEVGDHHHVLTSTVSVGLRVCFTAVVMVVVVNDPWGRGFELGLGLLLHVVGGVDAQGKLVYTDALPGCLGLGFSPVRCLHIPVAMLNWPMADAISLSLPVRTWLG